MVLSPPLIDQRSAAEIAEQMRSLLATYLPESFSNPATAPTKQLTGVNAALVQIFAHFAEIVIQRSNQVPDKNFLAFLDLLGASQLPPQPARVPLTFTLATGTTTDATVPAGTQVAAPALPGEPGPVIFETERELVVTSAAISSLFVRDPRRDQYADYTTVLLAGDRDTTSAFQGTQPIDHLFYLGHNQLFSYSNITRLQVNFTVVQALGDAAAIAWQIWNGTTWERIVPTEDSSQGMTVVGNQQLQFNNINAISIATVNTIENRWLRCQLLTPITQTTEPQTAMVRANQLPVLQNLNLQVTLDRTNLLPEVAFTNSLLVDLSQDFFPFGETPQFGSTFYFANQEAFAQPGATVTLQITLTNLNARAETPSNLGLRWECWNGRTWITLGSSNRTGAIAPVTNNFEDGTQAFTQNGNVQFTLPESVQTTTINGIETAWLRVRIVQGNYGEPERYKLEPIPSTSPNQPSQELETIPSTSPNQPSQVQYRRIEATLAPPVIQTLTIGYELTRSAAPEAIFTQNDFVGSVNLAVRSEEFAPFQATQTSQPSLYFGFSLPAGRTAFPNRPIGIYVRIPTLFYSEETVGVTDTELQPLRLAWDYFNGQTWQTLTVRDDTDAFSRSGLVEFLAPANLRPSTEFGLQRYWLRVRRVSEHDRWEPQLQQLLLNTTIAIQAETLRDEILGSSDGTENQRFRSVRAPILDEPLLDVREGETWIRWQEVSDFYSSSSRDRHYSLNHLTGELSFGNGQQGFIPQIGVGNIRLTRYQTGGGSGGNRAAGTIQQLKTTLPFISAVTNIEAAAGGADAESLDRLRDRVPRQIRHRDRAVTLEDYEDLAQQATSEVARAKCVPLYDLATHPIVTSETPIRPGTLSLIVIPRSEVPNPSPTLVLIQRVQAYLDRRRPPNANLIIVGPQYAQVNVTVEIALTTLETASTVEATVRQTLDRFLHPLTGGLDGTGWEFGRQPHKSDFYALLEAIPGIDHIVTLTINSIEAGRLFLVSSGQHQIRLTI